MVAERVLDRPGEVIPVALGGRVEGGNRDEFVPSVGAGTALGPDAAGQHDQELQASGHLPTAQVAGRRGTPGVRSKTA